MTLCPGARRCPPGGPLAHGPSRAGHGGLAVRLRETAGQDLRRAPASSSLASVVMGLCRVGGFQALHSLWVCGRGLPVISCGLEEEGRSSPRQCQLTFFKLKVPFMQSFLISSWQSCYGSILPIEKERKGKQPHIPVPARPT